MRADFSNLTFDPRLGFSRVLMQQGQLVTDAQTNEQTAIVLHLLRTLTRDLIGPHGGPKQRAAFELTTTPNGPLLGAGHYYVNGLMVEVAQPAPLWAQPFGALNVPDGQYLLVLDVWEQHLSAVSEAFLRDSAFAPARSADRAQVVWRVRAADLGAEPLKSVPPPAAHPDQDWWEEKVLPVITGPLAQRGLLSVALQDPGTDENPCLTDPDAGYRGETGQLLRVEIHRGGPAGTATFKWSFDNGSVVAPWTGNEDDSTLHIDVSGLVGQFKTGDWIELTGLRDDLDSAPQPFVALDHPRTLVQIVGLEDDELKITGLPGGTSLAALRDQLTEDGRSASIRRWDQSAGNTPDLWQGGARILQEGLDLELGQGVAVKFQGSDVAPHLYRSGDYWLILARSDGVRLLGQGEGGQFPPYGPHHAYAPVALVDVVGQKITAQTEYRQLF